MVYYKETYIFLRLQRGSNIFQEMKLFPRGVQMLISIKAYRTCDFPGGNPHSGSAHAKVSL